MVVLHDRYVRMLEALLATIIRPCLGQGSNKSAPMSKDEANELFGTLRAEEILAINTAFREQLRVRRQLRGYQKRRFRCCTRILDGLVFPHEQKRQSRTQPPGPASSHIVPLRSNHISCLDSSGIDICVIGAFCSSIAGKRFVCRVGIGSTAFARAQISSCSRHSAVACTTCRVLGCGVLGPYFFLLHPPCFVVCL